MIQKNENKNDVILEGKVSTATSTVRIDKIILKTFETMMTTNGMSQLLELRNKTYPKKRP